MKRDILLIGLGSAIGLIVGIVVVGAVFSLNTLFTHTIPETRESVQVFSELNELRQQINQMNEDRKRKEKDSEAEKEAAGRLDPAAGLPVNLADLLPKTEPKADKPPPRGDFAEVDAEIERLEQTQKILNAILDRLSTKAAKEK